MYLGKVAIFAVGTVVGGMVGYAAIKSDTIKDATKATIKAGIQVKDWTVQTFQKATEEVKEMINDAEAEIQVEAKA